MKFLVISNDVLLTSEIKEIINSYSANPINFISITDPLDLMTLVCTDDYNLLILDDDFIAPNSTHLLSSIRKVKSNIKIIFLTSNESLELGRAVLPLGIHYYGIKPVGKSSLKKLILSEIERFSSQQLYN